MMMVVVGSLRRFSIFE